MPGLVAHTALPRSHVPGNPLLNRITAGARRAAARARLLPGVLLAPALLAMGGCDDPSGPGAADRSGVSISNTAFRLDVGESVTLGVVIPGAGPGGERSGEWSSSNSAVVQVNNGGQLTAVAPGRAAVFVRIGGALDSATVHVGSGGGGGSPAWASVHAGDRFTCALDAAGERYCWGDNPFGAHGNGTRRLLTATNSPVAAGDPLRYRTLSGGLHHACGITVDGTGYCWGNNSGKSSNYELLPQRLNTPAALRDISSGLGHACALDVQDRRYCWGSNLTGALGMATAGGREVAPRRAEEAVRFASLSSGLAHTCGVSEAGAVYCWGSSVAGELGDGSSSSLRPLPHPVSGDVKFASVSAGNTGTCALTPEGNAYCWGVTTLAGPGGPRRGEVAVPTRVETDVRFAQVVVGAGHTCARTGDGEVFCWGLNDAGQSGVAPALGEQCTSQYVAGTVPCVSAPRRVSATLRFRQISSGRNHVCGVTETSELYCWGRNDAGQLGHGRVVPHSPAPVRVATALR